MNTIDGLGMLAGILTTLSFIPQVIKTWRSKSAADISTGMFILFSLGVLLWMIYGLYLNAMPIIIANGITLLLAMTILILKYFYSRKQGIAPTL